jgi:alkylhydroperoxidase/carboxymuconolactone decarboxylase family protein YurZ
MSKRPKFYEALREAHPAVVGAYEALGEATRNAGPLTDVEVELVKLGIAAGGRIEGAVHSHVRRALEAGAGVEAIRHVGLLAITTLGFANAMAVRAMIERELEKQGRA